MSIISAIEQEAKLTNDLSQGSGQYREGYVDALEIAAELVEIVSKSGAATAASRPAVKRMLELMALDAEFATPTNNDAAQDLPIAARRTVDCPLDQPRNVIDGKGIDERETQVLRMALAVIRSHDNDYADFLKFWLEEYGAKALSPNPPSLVNEMSFGDNFFDEGIVIDAPRYIC